MSTTTAVQRNGAGPARGRPVLMPIFPLSSINFPHFYHGARGVGVFPWRFLATCCIAVTIEMGESIDRARAWRPSVGCPLSIFVELNILHDQARRHGHGTIDLPFYHRSSR